LPVQFRRVPQVNDRMHANDGTIWRIDSIAQDLVEEGFFLVQIQKETASGEPLESIEIYSEDWSLYCLAHGLRLEPAEQPQAHEEASPATR